LSSAGPTKSLDFTPLVYSAFSKRLLVNQVSRGLARVARSLLMRAGPRV
jgi:hypothetical protein